MKPTIHEIQQRACDIWGISMEAMLGDARPQLLSDVRQLTMAVAHHAGYNQSVIGRAFNRLPSTVSIALKKPSSKYMPFDLQKSDALKLWCYYCEPRKTVCAEVAA